MSWLRRLADGRTLSRLFACPRRKRAVLLLAVLFLLAGLVLSFRQHPDILDDIAWLPLLTVVVVAVPVTVLLNAIEFVMLGRMLRQRVALRQALEVTVIGSAANMLPLPGALMVRVMALKAGGGRYRDGTAATLLVALIWLGVAFLYAGAWIVGSASSAFGTLFIVLGAVVTLGSLIGAVRLGYGHRLPAAALLLKFGLVITDASRLYLCLHALGIEAAFAQASALAVAGVLGSAVSIVPGGLGVREGVTAALAPIIGLGAAIGFLAAALNRLLDLLVVAPLALGLALRSGAEGRAASLGATRHGELEVGS